MYAIRSVVQCTSIWFLMVPTQIYFTIYRHDRHLNNPPSYRCRTTKFRLFYYSPRLSCYSCNIFHSFRMQFHVVQQFPRFNTTWPHHTVDTVQWNLSLPIIWVVIIRYWRVCFFNEYSLFVVRLQYVSVIEKKDLNN